MKWTSNRENTKLAMPRLWSPCALARPRQLSLPGTFHPSRNLQLNIGQGYFKLQFTITYRGSDWQLGMACGKHSRVCALSITDLSNANIIHLSGEYFIVIKRYTMVGKWKLTQSSYVGQAMTNSFVNSYLNYHLNLQIYTNKTFLVAFHKNSF